ncbi:MAG TPA: DUF1501 domain-containing protein [Gemmataceae bacterium]|nr:DUF1501 domain-containing protein [Gemmataceae bacterium]
MKRGFPVLSCAGPMHRRAFLRLGLAGLGSLSLADLFRLRARAGSAGGRRNALIVVWCHGGASHLETYDPKPAAPSEYRGPYRPIATRVPGLQLCELLPRHARVAHQFTLLRSLVHGGVCHDSGPQQIFTGRPVALGRLRADIPDLFSITHHLHNDATRPLPGYVGVGPIPYLGAAFLGTAHEPFAVGGDPNRPEFQVPNIGLRNGQEIARMNGRRSLRGELDRLQRAVDRQSGSFDAVQEQAWRMVLGTEARRAFDLNLENHRLRDRYGRNTWGQQCLMARRLVEAGVELVTVSLSGPLCGRVQNWDDHAVNHHVFDAMKQRAPYFDQAVSTLIEDLHERGLDRQVLVVVGGDFGRTPRISYAADSGSGVTQPGRDHWPHANSFIFSGGRIAEGQVIGATDRLGEHAVDRRVGVGDFAATLYRHLGVDYERITISDPAGRPIPILPEGRPIPELVARA